MTAKYQDTPSIVDREVTTVRPPQKLRYSDLTAVEKRDYLFDQGICATAYENYPDEKRPDVFLGLGSVETAWRAVQTDALSTTLTRLNDEFEQPKVKLFHTYGTTAKIRFTPEPDTPYTGIFSQTAYGLARFSYAGPVAAIGVVPGLGLKFPLDGDQPSQNLVVMRKLDPQGAPLQALGPHAHQSVFQNPFTNILPVPSPANLIMRFVKDRFETVVDDGKGLHQTLDNLAGVNSHGVRVEADKVIAPYRVIFRPTAEAIEKSDPTLDFRDDLSRNIKSGTMIYQVFALAEPQEAELNRAGVSEVEDLVGHGHKIGTITTESAFVASKYGDYRLFFQHAARYIRDVYRK
jgi:hypothetical protein